MGKRDSDGLGGSLKQISGRWRVWLAVGIGLGAVIFLFWRDFNPGALEYVQWGPRALVWLPVALLLMAGRDIGYIWRIRILSDGRLSLRQAFRTIMLWEFTSAVTPSAIGGTSVAILFVHNEGLTWGWSSAVVLATSFLDELYFLLMFPILVLMLGSDALFGIAGDHESVRTVLMWTAIGGYAVKTAYVVVLSYGFFVNPRGLKWLLLKIFKLPLLRRWRHAAYAAGSELVVCSKELKTRGFRYWGKAFLATFLSWTSRYWVANAIILAFFSVGGVWTHFQIFARQLVMWIMMLLMPTPGGSGFSEYVFTRYLGEFFPVDAAAVGSVAVLLALLWRMATYYPYLIAGAIVVPGWLRKSFGKGGGKK